MQRIYILVLSKIYNMTRKINKRLKYVLLGICVFCFVMNCILYTAWHTFGLTIGYAELLITNSLFLILIIVFSVDDMIKPVEWNKTIFIPWILCFILIIISGIHHDIPQAFLFSSFINLMIFPCLYFVWADRKDVEILYIIVCKATLLAFFIYFTYNLILSPLTEDTAYYGIAINPNSNGFIGLAGIISALYLICAERAKWHYILLSGMSMALIYVSLSRASVIAAVLVLLTFIICYYRSKIERKMSFLKTTLVIFSVIAVIFVSLGTYRCFLINITPEINSYVTSEMILEVYAEDQGGEDGNVLLEKFNKGDDFNELTSGRYQIWKAYVEKLNLLGNERGEMGLYIDSLGRNASSHNNYIEIAYRSGIPAGLLYAFVAVYAAIYAFRFMFSKTRFDYKLSFIPMAVVAFGVLSNLERAMYPLEKVHIFMFFKALIPMFVYSKEKYIAE